MNLEIKHFGYAKKIRSRATIVAPDGKSKVVNAMWDTGASFSLITESVALELQLEETSVMRVRHVAGVVAASAFTASVQLQGGMSLDEHRLVSMPNIHSFDMIIGMDIIVLGNFSLLCKNGNTLFCFQYPPE
jgi:hypothetical protein